MTEPCDVRPDRPATSAQRSRLRSLLDAAGRGPLTLVYGAKDEKHNQAVVLRDVLARPTRRT